MDSRPFSNADPFLQIIVLFLISFFCLGIFLLMGQGILNALWGVNLIDNPSALNDIENPQVVEMSRILLVFQHLGLFVVPAVVFAKLTSSSSWFNSLGFKPVVPQVVIICSLIMIASLPLINVMAWVNEGAVFPESLATLERVLLEMEEGAQKLTMAIAGTTSVPTLFVNLLIIAVLPAMGEEMIFRGLLLPILRKWTGNIHLAVWISAFLFSALHFQFYGFLPRMILGGLLGYLFAWTKSLWVPVIAHFVNNALALILIFMITSGYISEDVDSFESTVDNWLWVVGSLVAVSGLVIYLRRQVSTDTDV